MAKSRKTTPKQQDETASHLHFFGEREEPESIESLLDRRTIHGNRKIPAELRRMMTTKSVYINSGKATKPDIKIQQIKAAGSRAATWRVDLPINEEMPHTANALMGISAIKEKPAVFQKGISARTSFNGFRPEWIDGSYSPRIMTREQSPKLKRFRKGRVDPLYVFGADDRWQFRDPAWPWGLAGKVITSEGKTGTAALIGDRLIATAGHVVPWGQNGWWMRFVPAFYDGVSLHGAGVESYVSDARGYDVNGDVTGYDWAVCRLYEPLGNWLGYFGYNGYSSSWQNQPYWSIIGYPGAIAGAQRPSFQGSVTSDDTDGDSNGGLEIETKADLTPGNSGGPMFGWWNGDPRLIGVVSGQEEEWAPGFWPWEWADTELTNVIAGGAGFTNMMAWGRSNWPL